MSDGTIPIPLANKAPAGGHVIAVERSGDINAQIKAEVASQKSSTSISNTKIKTGSDNTSAKIKLKQAVDVLLTRLSSKRDILTAAEAFWQPSERRT